jgi:hypothetical protein
MSNEDASKKAQYWLDNNTMSKSKKEKEAEIASSNTDDSDSNEDVFG